jgi:hypothetical protein
LPRDVTTAGAVAFGFGGALALTTLILANLGATTRQSWLAWASTNLANLHDRPLAVLVASAFLVDGDALAWVALALVGLFAASRALGNARTVLLVATAHVVGTLVSEGILAYRIASGAAPAADRFLLDVGPSYVVVCALVAAIAYSTWPGRIASGAGFALAAPQLFEGLTRFEVSAVGHTCSVVVALAVGYPLARRS